MVLDDEAVEEGKPDDENAKEPVLRVNGEYFGAVGGKNGQEDVWKTGQVGPYAVVEFRFLVGLFEQAVGPATLRLRPE